MSVVSQIEDIEKIAEGAAFAPDPIGPCFGPSYFDPAEVEARRKLYGSYVIGLEDKIRNKQESLSNLSKSKAQILKRIRALKAQISSIEFEIALKGKEIASLKKLRAKKMRRALESASA